jgi:MoaA/NifB/PqqE/SkfB family radical SAM enzyme
VGALALPPSTKLKKGLSIMAAGEFKLSKHVSFEQVGSGRWVAWNGYFPKAAVLADDGVEFLRTVEEQDLDDPELAATAEMLLAHRIVYRGDADPYEDEFYASLSREAEGAQESFQRLYADRAPYGNLYFTNSACNLGCTYCVSHQADLQRAKTGGRASAQKRRAVAFSVLEQYLTSRREAGLDVAPIAFNGGEILLEWRLLRELLQHARTHFPELRLRCEMNSNMTRMTPQLASELSEFEIAMYTSIDGHRDHHNRTRVFRGGKGSYDEVIAGIEIFNKVAKRPIEGFQGTIDRPEYFSAAELFKMHEHGFVEARLAPNLLNISNEETERRAHLAADLFEAGQDQKLLYTDLYFRNVKSVAQSNHNGFTFYCAGLCGLPAPILTLNLDTTELSQLCSFAAPAALFFDSVEGDIYSPKLWEVSRKYVEQRVEVLRSHCRGCDVMGT